MKQLLRKESRFNIILFASKLDYMSPQQYTTIQGDTVIVIPAKEAFQRIPLNRPDNTLFSTLFIFIFLFIFAFMQLQRRRFLTILWNGLTDDSKMKVFIDEGFNANTWNLICGIIISTATVSAAAIYIFHWEWNPTNLINVWSYILEWHFLCTIIVYICREIFGHRQLGEEIICNLWVFNIMIGFCLAPFIMIIFFMRPYAIDYFIYCIFFILILFYSIKIYRWTKIISNYKIPILYTILYLCALEVVPLLIIYKEMVQ